MTLANFELTQLVAEANLAPSVHNTQPARWRFLPDGRCAVYEDCARRLTIADSTGRDAGISVGTAIEGMALALSKRGLALEATTAIRAPADVPVTKSLSLRWTGLIRGAADHDPLSAVVERRATYRGGFEPADGAARDRLSLFAQTAADAVVLTDRKHVEEIAAEHDAVSLTILRNRHYRSELVSWMRFSARHPRWSADGLNAEAMALSWIEAMGARCVLSDRLFPILDRIRLAGTLIAERAKVVSATALVLFHRPAAEQALTTGRRFYRLWLELTNASFDLCPMSVLADDPGTAEALCNRFRIAMDRRLVNVFRAGIRPASAPMRRVRLPAQSLILPAGTATEA